MVQSSLKGKTKAEIAGIVRAGEITRAIENRKMRRAAKLHPWEASTIVSIRQSPQPQYELGKLLLVAAGGLEKGDRAPFTVLLHLTQAAWGEDSTYKNVRAWTQIPKERVDSEIVKAAASAHSRLTGQGPQELDRAMKATDAKKSRSMTLEQAKQIVNQRVLMIKQNIKRLEWKLEKVQSQVQMLHSQVVNMNRGIRGIAQRLSVFDERISLYQGRVNVIEQLLKGEIVDPVALDLYVSTLQEEQRQAFEKLVDDIIETKAWEELLLQNALSNWEAKIQIDANVFSMDATKKAALLRKIMDGKNVLSVSEQDTLKSYMEDLEAKREGLMKDLADAEAKEREHRSQLSYIRSLRQGMLTGKELIRQVKLNASLGELQNFKKRLKAETSDLEGLLEILRLFSDRAMNGAEDLGGIDLNSVNLNMHIKRDGKGVPLPLGKQDLAQLSHIQGFEPVVLSIAPLTSTQEFLPTP